MMAPGIDPKPPMILAANAFSATIEADADGDEQDRRDQDAGQPAERGAVEEDAEDQRDDRNAEQPGRFPVLRGRLDLLADHRLLEDQVLQRHQDEGDDDDREVLGSP